MNSYFTVMTMPLHHCTCESMYGVNMHVTCNLELCCTWDWAHSTWVMGHGIWMSGPRVPFWPPLGLVRCECEGGWLSAAAGYWTRRYNSMAMCGGLWGLFELFVYALRN